jgi:hypothetical protein
MIFVVKDDVFGGKSLESGVFWIEKFWNVDF